MNWISLALAFLLVTGTLNAQGIPATREQERILIPFWHFGEIRGAHGSRWISEVSITNLSDAPIGVDAVDDGCRFSGCPLPMIPSGATIFPNTGFSDPFGVLLKVYGDEVDDLSVNLRIQDVSRQHLTWGTEIPVVSERAAFTETVSLSSIPINPDFRVLLRIYDFDPADCHRVNVRGYRVDPSTRRPGNGVADELLFERELGFQGGNGEVLNPVNPGGSQMYLDELPEVTGADRIRIEIEPLSDSLRFWAFASVTHNETQHVTLVTPRLHTSPVPEPPEIIAPACEAPSFLGGDFNPAVGTMIVRYNQHQPHETTEALASKYGFTHVHVDERGFIAELTPQVIASLRCEPVIAHILYDPTGCHF